MSDAALRELTRQMIRNMVRDLSRGSGRKEFESAHIYVGSNKFAKDVLRCGYPRELTEAVREMTSKSRIERHFIGPEILQMLKVWDQPKKTPSRGGGT